MRFAATTGILLYILTTMTRKDFSGASSDETSAQIHPGVRAFMAGFFEGDIVVPESDSRSGTNELPQKWPGGVVPYYLNSTLVGSSFFSVVRTAMRALEETTCLRFVKRTNQSDYLHLFSGQGCYSSVGRTGRKQLLSLGPGCLYVATAAHELLHAVGFHHEHTRPDRDTYITVLLRNVLEDLGERQRNCRPPVVSYMNLWECQRCSALATTREDTSLRHLEELGEGEIPHTAHIGLPSAVQIPRSDCRDTWREEIPPLVEFLRKLKVAVLNYVTHSIWSIRHVNQFVKRDWSSVTVPSPFDNQSVMLYGSDAFARNKYLPTILSKTGKRLPNVYEKTGLGYWDVQRVRIYYEC